ncbi:MAG: amylo-alpha-1,6-glucosidase [Rudaea sp.]
MNCEPASPFIRRLRNRISLVKIPFTERGSRLLLFRENSHLLIRLAERWYQWENEVGHYRKRLPLIDLFALLDENGNKVDFQLTSYPHALCFETRLGRFWLSFIDEESLLLTLPPGRVGLTFRVYAVRGRADRRGGEFKGDPEHRRTHRNVAYTTNAGVLNNVLTEEADGYLGVRLDLDAQERSAFVLNITPRLGLNRSIPPIETVLQAAEQRWHAWFAAVPPVDAAYQDQYYYAWWVLRAGLLSSRFFLTREAMIPSMAHYVGVWAWDAYFHALAYRHVDSGLAENQLRALIDHQTPEGMIPDAVYDEGIITHWKLPGSDKEAEVTKPPLLAWAALKLYEKSGHLDFIDELYEPLQRARRWWFEQSDDDHDGIMQYNHPNSSGLDDSPLWDDGMPVEAPDLNTYLVMQADALARMADILDLPEDAERLRAEAADLTNRLIAHSWDPEAGVFWAMSDDHRRVPTLTPFNLYPLLTGRLPPDISDRLIAHLTNPDEFWAEYPLRTVSRSDPKYDPMQMWRGPTWVNINYLFIEALTPRYPEIARTLRERTLALMLQQPDIHEYYNPDTGAPPPQAASVFGWSCAVFVDLAIQASRDKEP